jgi:predicted ATPase
VPVRKGFPSGDTADDSTAFEESVRHQLGRILQSSAFANAPSLSRFLRYLVERTLQGDRPPLNEYTLGVEVFDRGESFDPRVDNIVRVQVRRLRSKLDKYYAFEGQVDRLVIDVPRGRYEAVFQAAPAEDHGVQRTFDHDSRGLANVRIDLPPPLPLPVPCTSFIGREKELAHVKQLLRSEHVRLVTLSGAGGSGKTRLALRAAGEMTEGFPGGVYLLSLASVIDPGTVVSTIAQNLGLRHTGGMPLPEALQLYVRSAVQAPTLLLLDNFEQVVSAAPLLTALLASSPRLKMLVTSRAVLDLSGEYDFPVPCLPAPDPKQLPSFEELVQNPAVALFLERATAVDPGFALDEDNSRAVAEICVRLDGLPLAIELAAARVKILPPAALLAYPGNSLDLLTCGPRDVPSRQQTLRKTIDWTYSLLSAAEQTLFRRLAVFSGGCTLESAEAVCNTRRDLEIPVLDGISSMVNKHLLQRKEEKAAAGRFTMLQTVREYALERLRASGEEVFTRRAHAAYCVVLAEEGAAQMAEEDRANWLTLWDAEYDNLRDALDWLIRTESGQWALRLGTALFAFWERREHLAEGRERLEAVLNMRSTAAPTGVRARAAWYAAIFADQQGDFGRAIWLHHESLRIYRELGDRKGTAAQLGYVGLALRQAGKVAEARTFYEESVSACRQLGDGTALARALSNFAEFSIAQGDRPLASSLFEEALSIFREIGDGSGFGWSLNHLGDLAFEENDLDEASRLYRAGYDVFQGLGDRWGMARSLTDLGRLASEQSEQEDARLLLRQALRTFVGLGHTRGVARVLEELACVAVREQNFEHAITLSAAAEGLLQRIGKLKRQCERARLDRILQPAWRETDPFASRAAWANGLRMPMAQAINYALNLTSGSGAFCT